MSAPKQKTASLTVNYFWRLLYEVLIFLIPVFTTPYIARVLGSDGVGTYSYTYSTITYFMLIGALGTKSYGAREISRNRDNPQKVSQTFWEIELLTVFTTGMCLVVWFGFIAFSSEYRIYYLALLPFLLGTMFDISWFFTGLEKINVVVAANSIVRLAGAVLIFTLVKTKDDLIFYFLIHSLSNCIGSLLMWASVRKFLVKVDYHEFRFRTHFKETLIYFIPTIATSIYTVLDKTLIGLITKDLDQNGYYEEATKIISIIKSLVFVAVNAVMGVRISYLFAEERYEEIKQRIRNSISFIYLLAYGAMFGIMGVARRFIPFFLGKGFEPVTYYLYLMAPLVLIIGTSNCLGNQYYTPSGQRKLSAKIIIIGAITNLCLNLILIPFFNTYGAIIASIIAEILITVLYVKKSNGYCQWSYLWKCSWKRLIAGGLMLAVLVFIDHALNLKNWIIVLIQVAGGVLVYFSILLLMKDSMVFQLLGKAKAILLKKKG